MFKHPSRVAQDALHEAASKPLDLDDSSSEESSEYETEDSDGDELTPAMDAAILRTLGRIRRGEGVESGRNVFEEEQAALASTSTGQPEKKRKEKSMNLSDFQRRALLSSAGASSSRAGAGPEEPAPYSHAEEQERLRQETLNAFGGAVDEDGDGDEMFVKKGDGAGGDIDLEDEEYRAFLLNTVGGEQGAREALFGPAGEQAAAESGAATDGKKEKRKKKRKVVEGGEEDLEQRKKEEEEFLLDYILNRGWIDRETVAAPSSSTLAAASKSKKAKSAAKEDADAGSDLSAEENSQDEDYEDAEEEFEVKYNFRFEEPGAEYITAHPRALPSLARREDTSRKTARAAKAARKAEEKLKREEEKKQRKAAKRKEIETKLTLLGAGKGGKEVRWEELGLDDDFDDAAHEAKMRELFESGNDFIEGEDGEKPTWDDEDGGNEGYLYGMPDFGDGEGDGDGEDGAIPDYGGEDGMDMDVPEGEEDFDGPINMDADAPDDEVHLTARDKKKAKKDKKSKKKSKGKDAADVKLDEAEVGELKALAETGDFESKKRKVDELMDEYDKLDYEDMIGNLPTRFHYTKTTPQSYGLSPTEILLATDAELNAFLGIKQYAAFRADGGAGAGKVGRDKRLWELKKALKGRKWGEEPEDERKKKRFTGVDANGEKIVGKKRKGKKERMKEQAAAAEAAAANGEAPAPAASSSAPPAPAAQGESEAKPKKKKRKVAAQE